jgi:hypothetical protein
MIADYKLPPGFKAVITLGVNEEIRVRVQTKEFASEVSIPTMVAQQIEFNPDKLVEAALYKNVKNIQSFERKPHEG